MKPDARVDRSVLDKLEQRVGPAVLGQIIDLFLEHHGPRLQAFQQARRSEDLEASAEALHSIKGSAAMLGATRLEDLALRMETLARDGDLEGLTKLVDDLLASSTEVVELLREHRKALGS